MHKKDSSTYITESDGKKIVFYSKFFLQNYFTPLRPSAKCHIYQIMHLTFEKDIVFYYNRESGRSSTASDEEIIAARTEDLYNK